MHIAIRQGVDKINSLQADSLLSEEIDLELNKNMRRFINLKYGKNNQYNKGFEESQKRIDDLSTLVAEHKGFIGYKDTEQLAYYTTTNNTKFLFRDYYNLPYDYMHHIESSCTSVRRKTGENIGFRFEAYNDNDYNIDTYEQQVKYFVVPFQVLQYSRNMSNSKLIIKKGFTTGEAEPVYGEDYSNTGDDATVAGPVLEQTIWELTSSNSILDLTDSDYINFEGTFKKYKDYIIEHVLTNHHEDVAIRWEKSGNIIHKDSFIVIIKPDSELYKWVRTEVEASYVVDAIGSNGYDSSGSYVTSSPIYTQLKDFTSILIPFPEYAEIEGDTSDIEVKSNVISVDDIVGTRRKPSSESASNFNLNMPVTYVQHDDLQALLKDPFNRPGKNSVFGVFTNNSIELYTTSNEVDRSPNIPDMLKLKYLRTPLPMSLVLDIDCELPAHTHEEIVAMTVSSLLEGIADPRYKSHMGEVMRQE